MFSNTTVLLAWLLGGCSSPPEGIILVSIDTLRADALSVYGAPTGSSPFLDEFASEAVVFEHAYSQSNETLFSHASMFTSRRVTALGELTYDLTITEQTPSLAMQLQQAGLRTGAVVASGHLARIFGLDDGFEDYFEGPDWGSFQETLPLALNWLDRVIEDEEDFFLFLHSYDCHNPYTKPGVFGRLWTPGYVGPFLPMSSNALMYEKIYRDTVFPRFTLNLDENDAGVSILAPDVYRLLPLYAARSDVLRIELGQEDLSYIRGLYATSVFYVDLYIGALMNELDRRGLLETTTIVIMSDHGEELLDHGFINHRHTLHDESTHVPLMVRLPGGQGGGTRHSEVVELTDVAPTIIDMVKGAVRPTTMGGSSLARCIFEGESCAVREVAYSEGVLQESTVTDGQFRLIVRGIPPSSSRYDQWVSEARAERILLFDRLGPGGLYTNLANQPDMQQTVQRLKAAMLARRKLEDGSESTQGAGVPPLPWDQRLVLGTESLVRNLRRWNSELRYPEVVDALQARADLNADGLISSEEYIVLALPGEDMAAYDENADQQLDPLELEHSLVHFSPTEMQLVQRKTAAQEACLSGISQACELVNTVLESSEAATQVEQPEQAVPDDDGRVIQQNEGQ